MKTASLWFALLWGIQQMAGATSIRVIDVADRVAARPLPPAFFAGSPAVLSLLVPPGHLVAPAATARLYQLGGTVALPLATDVELGPDPADPRLLLARFTPPAVDRVTQFALRIGDGPALVLAVHPADVARADLPSLAEALASRRMRLAVCGAAPVLRQWLSSRGLVYDDLGDDAADRVPSDTLLVGVVSPEDWRRLADPREASSSGVLLAFVSDPARLPGVYPEPAGVGGEIRAWKITLPLLPDLSADPRASDAFHHLIHQALAP